MFERAFQYVAHYDICIANYLEQAIEGVTSQNFIRSNKSVI